MYSFILSIFDVINKNLYCVRYIDIHILIYLLAKLYFQFFDIYTLTNTKLIEKRYKPNLFFMSLSKIPLFDVPNSSMYNTKLWP